MSSPVHGRVSRRVGLCQPSSYGFRSCYIPVLAGLARFSIPWQQKTTGVIKAKMNKQGLLSAKVHSLE